MTVAGWVVLAVVGALLLLAAVLVGLYLSRQRTLSQRVGSFSCWIRPEASRDASWTPGIAQYATGRLLWWRTLSLSPRPACSWSRTELTLVERRTTADVDDGGHPLLQVDCRHGEDTFQLSMSAPACAGLVSWLESGPRPVGRVI